MNWDGHRSTKRGEDVTYRLLGLLGLDMPLLYGERGVTTFKSSHLGIPGRSVGPTLVMQKMSNDYIDTGSNEGISLFAASSRFFGPYTSAKVEYCSDRLSRTFPEGWRCKLWCLATSSHRVTRPSGFNVPCAADRVQWRSPLISFYTISAFCASSGATQMTLEKCMVSW